MTQLVNVICCISYLTTLTIPNNITHSSICYYNIYTHI